MKSARAASLATVLLPLWLGACLHADPLDTWVQRSPSPTSQDILGITYVAGEFLGSIGFGGLISSSDGMKWATRPVLPDNMAAYSISGVAYGAGLYVAVSAQTVPAGFQGTILTSTNANDWTSQWSGVALPFQSVAYGLGQFVAVGGIATERAIATSNDGILWTVQVLSDEGALSQVIFYQGRFYAVGNFGAILSSDDGITWQQFTAPVPNQLNSIVGGSGRLIVVGERGQFLTSTNGVSWTTNGPALNSRPALAFGNGRFVMVENGQVADKVWISTNGVGWTYVAGVRIPNITAMTHGRNEFVAVGTHGAVATSEDGFAWTTQSTGVDLFFKRVAAGGGTVMAMGNDSPLLLKTDDGSTWSPAGVDANYLPFGIGFANGQFIVFARDNRGPRPIVVLTSSDGSTWARNDLTSAGAGNRIIYAHGLYVAVGNGVLISPDSRHWTTVPVIPQNDLTGVAYGNGRFVAVGTDNAALSSTDGSNWFSSPTGSNILTDIAFGNGRFIAIGNGFLSTGTGLSLTSRGDIFTSIDGKDWIPQTTPFGPSAGVDLGAITYGAGWFVIVGAQGLVLTSSNGTDWVSRRAPTTDSLASVAYADGTFVAVGSRGTTVFSDNVLGPTLQASRWSSAGFSFAATGQAGQIYHIQATGDLNIPNWTEIGMVTNKTGTAMFADPGGNRSRARYYRLAYP